MHNTKFISKTIVINKNKILKYIVCFTFGMIMFSVVNLSSLLFKNNINFSEDMYKYTIDTTLPSVISTDKPASNSSFSFDEYFAKKVVAMTLPITYEDLTCNEPDTDNTATEVSQAASVIQPAESTPEPSAVQEYPIEDISINGGSDNGTKQIIVSNETNYKIDTNEFLKKKLSFDNIKSTKPTVLIVHTHTTESYTANGKNTYTQNDNDRSTDESKNIIKVGEAFAAELKNNGINVIHDKTVHDYPSYNGAYQRSLATINANLKKYPSIQIVLDIHRDGIVRTDGTKVGVSAQIDGKKTAQVMLVVGTDANGLTHTSWRDNAAFAFRLHDKAIEMYPGIIRPLNIRKERFNQHLTKGSLILEIGSNGNTLEEAILGATDFAKVMAQVLSKY